MSELSNQAQLGCSALTRNIAQITEEIKHISENADAINKNKNFKIPKSRVVTVEKEYNGWVTQCLTCYGKAPEKGNGICHLGCEVEDVTLCDMMSPTSGSNPTKICKICGCLANKHISSTKYFVEETMTYYEDNQSMKSKFSSAHAGLDTASKLVIERLEEQEQQIEAFEKCKDVIRDCDKFLKAHAIRKTPFRGTQYLEEQIEMLTKKGTRDSKAQAKVLQEMLDTQRAMMALKDGELHVSSGGEDRKIAIDKQYFARVKANISSERAKLEAQSVAERDVGLWSRTMTSLGNIFSK
jgi:hypothetical protein